MVFCRILKNNYYEKGSQFLLKEVKWGGMKMIDHELWKDWDSWITSWLSSGLKTYVNELPSILNPEGLVSKSLWVYSIKPCIYVRSHEHDVIATTRSSSTNLENINIWKSLQQIYSNFSFLI